jgi:hypothetical protein
MVYKINTKRCLEDERKIPQIAFENFESVGLRILDNARNIAPLSR